VAKFVPFPPREAVKVEYSEGMVMRYDSLADFEAAKPSMENRQVYNELSSRNTSWLGTSWLGASFEETCRIIGENQWPEGMAKMEKALAGLGDEVPPAKSIKRRRGWHDSGDSLDMSRVWGGQLDQAWQRCDRVQMAGTRRVTITYPLIYSAAASADSMFWGGAAALKLSDILTAAGYAVEIVGIHGTFNKSRRAFMAVTSKPFHAPLDMQALIVPMAFAGYMRTVGFAGIVAKPVPTTSALGSALYNPYQQPEIKNHLHGEIIPAEMLANAAEAKHWLKKQISKLQGEDQLAA
jgi:hypothetical protein